LIFVRACHEIEQRPVTSKGTASSGKPQEKVRFCCTFFVLILVRDRYGISQSPVLSNGSASSGNDKEKVRFGALFSC